MSQTAKFDLAKYEMIGTKRNKFFTVSSIAVSIPLSIVASGREGRSFFSLDTYSAWHCCIDTYRR
jgi:hypothetical protein